MSWRDPRYIRSVNKDIILILSIETSLIITFYDICLTKIDKIYVGFSLVPTKLDLSDVTSYLYLNTQDMKGW